MGKLDSEIEKRILETLPLITRFFKNDMRLTENQFKPLVKFHHEAFEWARNSTPEEFNTFLIDHRDNRIFKEHIDVLLSPEGRKYTKYLLELTKKWAP